MQTKAKTKTTIKQDVDVELSPAPKVTEGELAMRMIYTDGTCRDIVAKSMLEAVIAAEKQATSDGKHFRAAQDVQSWERVA